MPRIAVALGVLAAVAFCIGFNTVRYPVVWEMLKQPGLPVPTAKAADAPAPATLAAKPTRPAAKSTQSAGSASKPVGNVGRPAAKAAKEADPEPEFCTADGVCHIAAGPRATTKKGPSPAPDSRADRTASLPELPRDASLDDLGKHAAEAIPAAAKLARVERPLVPVLDCLPVSPLRPLPPVDELAAAAPGPAQPQPASASTPFYPTTGYPAVDLGCLRSAGSGSLMPVSQPGS